MTRACRDCKWAKLPTFEGAKEQAITLNHNCLIACVKLQDAGEPAFLKDADGICDQWEPWAVEYVSRNNGVIEKIEKGVTDGNG